jgi:tRNA A-37 threonylcarbamoyl transferase component Bud32
MVLLALAAPVSATQVFISVSPGECGVKMDGIELGTTFQDGTFKPFDLPPGEHIFLFEKAGYESSEQKVNVAGDSVEIKATLTSLEEKRRAAEEEARRIEEARRADEERKAAEVRKQEQARRAEEERRAEAARKAEEERRSKRMIALGVAVGGGLLLLIAGVVLILSRRKPQVHVPHQGTTTSTGIGTDTSGALPGFFSAATGPHDVNAILASANMEGLVGKRILGEYLVERKIGQGGMGAILLAKQESLDRHAAIKIILPKFAENENVVKRFFREVKLTSRLEHPNIVTIYSFGKSREGILFVSMEYLDGPGLDRIIKTDGAMDPARAVRITAQIASALKEAHSKGVVHRDLKPSNIMLINRGGNPDYAKVLDFGIAKSIEDHDANEQALTMSGQILGTPAYMSPEQCMGKHLDHRTDIYSLGIIAFELISGKKPFYSDSAIGFMQQHMMTPPPRVSEMTDGRSVPSQVDEVFFKVLAKDPEGRYESAVVFAKDLAQSFGIELNLPWVT